MGLKDYVEKKKAELKEYQAKRNKEMMIKQAEELRKLKETRQREEGAARLRAIKQRELKRIEKARATGQAKPQQQSQGSGSILNFDTGFLPVGGGQSSGNMFDIGSKSSSSNSMFDIGFGSPQRSKPKRKAKRSHKRKR